MRMEGEKKNVVEKRRKWRRSGYWRGENMRKERKRGGRDGEKGELENEGMKRKVEGIGKGRGKMGEER